MKQVRVLIPPDVEQKKMDEENLQKVLKEISDYKYALDESSIVAITDHKGIIKHVNENFCKISKYSAKELIGQDHRIINSGYHPKEFIHNLWVTIANGKIWRGELKNKAKDGAFYWVDTTIVPFLNEQGKPYQYVAIRADITERKKIEEEQLLYKLIVHSSDDAIISKDLNGIITSWNRGAENIFGYPAEEVLGKHISILIPQDRFDEEPFIIEKIKKGEYIDHYETERVRKDGKLIQISLTASPIKDSNGNIVGASKISRDVTEHKRIENEIKQLNEKLEEKVKQRTLQLQLTNEELEAFTYSVSHDLRSPLRIISGYADILSDEYSQQLDLEGKRILNNITINARQMGRLIDDLLQLSRFGRKEIDLYMTDMNSLVKAALHDQSSIPAFNTSKFIINDLASAYCDSDLMKQVWINLLSNAIKYSSRQHLPVIEINSEIKEAEIIYSIKDNGVGFDMKYADKLFGVFQRLHKVSEFEGTGVGLAIVYRIINKHKGNVWAEAELGKGATFYFSLPLKNNDIK